jgi:hypothetical protein
MYVGDDCPTQVRTPHDEAVAMEMTRKLQLDPRSRARRLARIKQAVECADYENALKLSVALDRLLEKLK